MPISSVYSKQTRPSHSLATPISRLISERSWTCSPILAHRQRITLGGENEENPSESSSRLLRSDVSFFRSIRLFDQNIISYPHRKVRRSIDRSKPMELCVWLEGELAPAILATVQTATQLVDVIIVHMGNDHDDLDRKLQAEKLRDIMKNRFALAYRGSCSLMRSVTCLARILWFSSAMWPQHRWAVIIVF